MRGYHAFLKQVPTSPPPMQGRESDVATVAPHDGVVTVNSPQVATDREPQSQFLSGIAAHPGAASESDA